MTTTEMLMKTLAPPTPHDCICQDGIVGTVLFIGQESIGKCMVDEAEKAGLIHPVLTVLVEPTPGNTVIALAFTAREQGYRCILTISETMWLERRMMLLLALGCEV
jgi:cysteine synthase